jgi:hypothetical protein
MNYYNAEKFEKSIEDAEFLIEEYADIIDIDELAHELENLRNCIANGETGAERSEEIWRQLSNLIDATREELDD